MELGMHTTLLDANSKLDPEVIALAERITPDQSKEFGVVWDLFRTRGTPFQTDEYTILTRGYTAPEVVVQGGGSNTDWDNASDTTALPVSSGTIDRITVGDALLVEAEIVVVKSVDRSGNTIDVYERGAGETTGARHGTSAITAKVVGNAHLEGTVDATAMAETTGVVTNYCQIVEELVDLSKEDSDQARKNGTTAEILKKEAMERVMKKLARTAIFGTGNAGTSSLPAMTRGLLGHLNLAGGIKTSLAGAFTETALKNGLDDVRKAGGTVNAIVLSINNKRIANGFTGSDTITTTRDAKVGGQVLDGYLADGFGIIPFIVDIDMPDTDVALVNSAKMSKGWKVNDILRFVPETNTSSRERKETLQGKFGLAIEGIGTSHALLTDIQ